ncbi:hypothetical protein VTO42DRAFT_4129 [Malbranchea cinnamomea]
MSLKRQSICCKILHLGQRCRSRRLSPTITSLPLELVLKIASFLPLPSQACLALSCKYMLWCLAHSLQNSKEWQISQRISHLDGGMHHYYSSVPVWWPRLKRVLLGLWKTGRWRYCEACLTLHSTPDFCTRIWRYGQNRLLSCIRPLNAAWKLSTCRCFAVRFGDRVQLAKELQAHKPQHDCESRLLKHFFRWDGSRYVHRCWDVYPGAIVRREVSPKVDIGEQLFIKTRLRVTAETHPQCPWKIPCNMFHLPVRLCCSYRLLNYLQIATCGENSVHLPIIKCSKCDSSMMARKEPSTPELQTYTFTKLTYIGCGERPEKDSLFYGSLTYLVSNGDEYQP